MAEDIKFGVGADAGPFRRVMAGLSTTAKGAGKRASSEFTKSFNNEINKYLGVGAFIALSASIARIGKEAQKVQISAILEGVTPERVQAIEKLSEHLGGAFSNLPIDEQIAFADQLIQSGDAAIRTSEQIRELADQYANLAKAGSAIESAMVKTASVIVGAWNKVQKGLTDFFVGARLMWSMDPQDIREGILMEVQRAKGEVGGASAVENIARQIADRPKQSQQTRSRSPVSGFQTPVDNLQRMGLFVGGAGNPAITIAREQVNLLKQIHQEQRRMVAALNEL